MLVTLAGAMSTAELGKSLAAMIRQGQVHAICCTGANLEEDLFNLIAHKHYKRLPHYRELTALDEHELLAQGYNRVTDTCIPEQEAMRKVEELLMGYWQAAHQQAERYLPHHYLYALLASGQLAQAYQIPQEDSWLLAAFQHQIPLFVPGWEDSTLGNVFSARCIEGVLCADIVLSGIHYMQALVDWYTTHSQGAGIGFFQVGGGIAGDFPICVVPLLLQDLKRKHTPLWRYFCQVSDSTSSYGSYSGAPPNEKITWGKLSVDTPRFVIESDATIVVPLLFAYVLDW